MTAKNSSTSPSVTPFKKAAFATIFILFFSGAACVSVNLGPSKAEKSSGVQHATPAGAFKEIKNDRADAAWNNSASGSTIAFQSSCSETADATLESIGADLFSGFENDKVLRDELIPFDGREALSKEIEGKVDGVMTRVRAVIYKKNRCSYVLTLVSLVKNAAQAKDDVAQFENFTKSFKAP